MALTPGTRLGPYEVTAQIGVGGMGEVYRATDTNLRRQVAVKVLPEAFAQDADRLARFEREAKTLASLNHTNIAQIYGLERSHGTTALVMELIGGPTLSDRIAQGPIPLEEALPIARQIAEALEAAHEQGIIHRDLKPANIKLRSDGTVKVLDFGLAKALDSSPGATDVSQSPTITSPAVTGMGVILGTAAYMSPEQARGKPVDKRADIWAFGCVLYEMLTGRTAFGGQTISDIIAAILGRGPDWQTLPETVPGSVRRLLQRCLEKDPKRRLHDIADARLEIDAALHEPDVAVVVPAARRIRERGWWIAALTASLAALAIVVLLNVRRAPSDAPETRLGIVTPPGAAPTRFAISPDGHNLVFTAIVEGTLQLWLRPLDSETAQPLAATENGYSPFWSPDSRSVGFFADGQLKRIDIAGGPAQGLASAPTGLGGAWSKEGTILFSPQNSGPLYRVPAGGGEAVEVTHVDPPRQTSHWHPDFLPDGQHFLFFAWGLPEATGVYLGSLDSKEQPRRLFESSSLAVFAPPDRVLYARQGALLGQRLDLKTLEPVGDPSRVAGAVVVDVGCGYCIAVSASVAGPIAYRARAAERQLVWVDRSGREIGTVGAPDAALPPQYFRLSPDGRTVALRRDIGGAYADVWLMDAVSGALQKFTFEAGNKFSPIWSPNGHHVVLSSDPKGILDLYEKPVEAVGNEALLWPSSEHKFPLDWSQDGFILYESHHAKTGTDLWALPLAGDKKPIRVADTAAVESNGRFSPDSHWIAYHSNETGRDEIYIQPFQRAGGKSKPLSITGGSSPQWGLDGRELFYVSPDNRLMAVPINLNGSTAEGGKPVTLFALPLLSRTLLQSEYFASRDGQRFLISKIVKDASPITILLNWKPPAK